MQLALRLPANSELPVYRQVAEAIKEAMIAGSIRPGEKLPSSRELADSLDLSRLTVNRAYQDLAGQGYIRIIPGSGTYASFQAQQESTEPDAGATTDDGKGGKHISLSPWGERLAECETLVSPMR